MRWWDKIKLNVSPTRTPTNHISNPHHCSLSHHPTKYNYTEWHVVSRIKVKMVFSSSTLCSVKRPTFTHSFMKEEEPISLLTYLLRGFSLPSLWIKIPNSPWDLWIRFMQGESRGEDEGIHKFMAWWKISFVSNNISVVMMSRRWRG